MSEEISTYQPQEDAEKEGIATSEPQNRSRLWWQVSIIIFLVLLLDQGLKVWVKTSMLMNERIYIFGDWFQLLYTENPGMAFGLEIGGAYGKLFLTFFRIFAVVLGFWVLYTQIKKNSPKGFIWSIALILAGAMGNIIDSVFYGAIFKEMNLYSGTWFQGWVVDMLYFPLVNGVYPAWIPKIGGNDFTFFSPIFNLADAAISVGVFAILLFQKKFFPKEEQPNADSQPGNEVYNPQENIAAEENKQP